MADVNWGPCDCCRRPSSSRPASSRPPSSSSPPADCTCIKYDGTGGAHAYNSASKISGFSWLHKESASYTDFDGTVYPGGSIWYRINGGVPINLPFVSCEPLQWQLDGVLVEYSTDEGATWVGAGTTFVYVQFDWSAVSTPGGGWSFRVGDFSPNDGSSSRPFFAWTENTAVSESRKWCGPSPSPGTRAVHIADVSPEYEFVYNPETDEYDYLPTGRTSTNTFDSEDTFSGTLTDNEPCACNDGSSLSSSDNPLP